MGKRRKQIARKGLHTAKDEAEKMKLVKKMILIQRYGTEGPTNDYERVFWENLKTMFDAPLSTDLVWSLPERKYPLSANVCQTMLKMKLLDGKMNEDCYKLLKMVEKQDVDLDLFKLAIGLQKANQIQDFGPTTSIQHELHATTNAKSQRHLRSDNGNQFGYNAGQNAGTYIRQNTGNLIPYNTWQNAGNLIGQNERHNRGFHNVGNQNGLIIVPTVGNQNGNGNVVAARTKNNGIQHQAAKFDSVAAATDCEEIEEVNASCILLANLRKASTSGIHADKVPVYDSDGSAEDDSNVIPVDSNMNPSGGDLEQHPATIEVTCAFYESLYNNSVIEVEKVNMVNHETKEANVKLTVELTRYRNPFYLKQAQKKQQSLYNGNVLLDKHDPPAVYNLEKTLQLAQ
ncbi:hypothetical protein Tco_0706840 [Tanacetum coccineum]|uniref:Uncharacterized protein n=1 Tax=Tanacetum coccineum TaxID=301880 RepID=A0ABQ4Y8I4_9ASTR